MSHQSNSSLKSRKLYLNQTWVKQKGAALIFIAFILGLGAAVYVLKTYNSDAARARQDEKTYKALNDAKIALIAWAVSHPNTPGLMPYPDRNGDLNYDDTSDCYASNINFSPTFTIGRLPLFKSDPNCVNAQSTVTSGIAGDFRDGGGERLWYEVSQNLLHDYKSNGDPAGTSPIINPSIVNTPTNGWFVVVDRSGKVLSDRVAAVIIAPGAAVGDQDRSSGVADANQYLDKIVMANGTTYKNYTYYDSAIPMLKQEFIVGDDLSLVSKDDPTYKNQTVEPYYFNDKLVYITIDELMDELERRAAQEAKAQLRNHSLVNSAYPYAAVLGDSNNACSQGNLKGFLPVSPASANCTTATDCIVNLPMTNVTFTLTAAEPYGSTTGACYRKNTPVSCTCSGAGSCKRATAPTRTFICATNGGCSSTGMSPDGSFTFTYAPKIPDSTVVNSACTGAAGSVTCNGIGDFVSHTNNCIQPNPELITLPRWFTDNLWQDYFYYELSPTSSLQAGAKTGLGALLVGAGQVITSAPYASKGSPQSRPPTNASPNLNDYLDSSVNTDGNSVFDATNKQKSSNYNDQTYIVAP